MSTASPFRSDVLAGKRILVTGGGTGLGAIMARTLAAHGAAVHIWGRRENVLAETVATLDGEAHFQAVDIRDGDAVDAAVQAIWDEHGPLTGLINNAAANFIAPTKDLSPRAYRAVASTVMDGAFHCTLACGKRWIDEGIRGSVLSMLATWIWSGSAFVVPSAMGKAAVHAMTMSLAVEWGPHGIRLNALAPGPFPTEYAWEMLNPTDGSSVGATQSDNVPLDARFGRPEELENIVVFLFSDACDYMTGAALAVDGAQRHAGPGTFAGLTSLKDEDWRQIRETSRAASEKAKADRSA